MLAHTPSGEPFLVPGLCQLVSWSIQSKMCACVCVFVCVWNREKEREASETNPHKSDRISGFSDSQTVLMMTCFLASTVLLFYQHTLQFVDALPSFPLLNSSLCWVHYVGQNKWAGAILTVLSPRALPTRLPSPFTPILHAALVKRKGPCEVICVNSTCNVWVHVWWAGWLQI